MASFVCVIAKSQSENWDLCKKYNRWGMRRSHVSINHAKKIKKGDRLFVWIGGVGYVGLAESEVDEPIKVTDVSQDVWNMKDGSYIIPWKLIKEIEPELLNFIDKSQEETRIPQPWMQNGFFQIGTHASRTLSRIFDVEHKEVESKFDPQNKYATKNMERYFNSSDRTIRSVIDDISYGRIQLPDLQRPFTWRTDQTTALFDSIYKGFPIGYIMLWRNSDKNISRKIGTSKDSDFIDELVLDGQQRLTSLYSVIKSEKVINRKYEEVNHNVAFNPLIETFETKNAATQNDPEFISDISELFSNNFNQTQFINDFIENIQLSREISKDEENQIQAAINRLYNIQNMPLQVLYLSDNVNQEDAKEIFVRINSSGTNLTHADFLLTLISVRWKEGREAISEFVKERIKNNENITPDATQIIRSIGMLAFKIARVEAIYNKMDEADDDELIQFQKAQNTTLNLNNWNDYLNCISEAGFISKHIVKTENIVFFCYGFYLLGKSLNVQYKELRKIISKWFFMNTVTRRYVGSFETTVQNDLNQLESAKSSDEFIDILDNIIKDYLTQDFWEINIPRDLANSSKTGPLYRTFLASQILLDTNILFSESKLSQLIDQKGTRKGIELHHLFPKNYLKNLNYSNSEINKVSNLTFLEWRENAEVLDNSPSDYFQNHFETVPRSQKDKMLENHALWDNWPDYEYDNFLIERRKRISDVIKKGWETLIDKNFESNHFSKNSINTTMPWEHSVEDFIGKNIESENLEYKSTYQWDTKQNKQNPDVLKPIIVRTIASFLNAKGGTLLIGIDDEGKVLGIENDLNIFNGSFDDLQKNISNYIADTIGKEHIHQIGIKILPIDDKNIIRIDVEKSFTEVWIKYKGSRDEEFFVRFGPTSNRLSPKEASEYINRNFNN